MKKLYLIGDKITDSPSPAMQNAALSYLKLGEEFTYEILEIQADKFEERILELKSRNDVAGFNVTKPYKSAILKYIDESDSFTRASGACNFVCARDGRWIGKNTDGYGFVMPLIKRGISLTDASMLFFGAGGAARAAILQSINNGAAKITLVNRNMEKANALKKSILENSKFAGDNFLIYNYSDLQNKKLRCIISLDRIIVNATSAFQNNGDLPVAFDEGCFNKSHVVYDLSYYKNVESSFIKSAKNCGCVFLRGGEMLAYQGLMSFFHWTSKKPPFNVFLNAIESA